GYLVLWTRQDKKAHWLPAADLDAAARLAERLATTCDVYCGVALQDRDSRLRGGQALKPTKNGLSRIEGAQSEGLLQGRSASCKRPPYCEASIFSGFFTATFILYRRPGRERL